jgi:ABC-type Fe3+-hydroxamate transport system substrate-binding protein
MNQDWYLKIADATKRREKAKLYLEKWQEELADAETELRGLALEQVSIVPPPLPSVGPTGEWSVHHSSEA